MNLVDQRYLMNKSLSISLILPCHNEEIALPVILPRVQNALTKIIEKGHFGEVIVVDDGSTDQSREILDRHSFLSVVRIENRQGYGHALKEGFRHAKGEWIVFFDLDNTYFPEDLDHFLAEADKEVDLVMGYRSFFSSGMPFARKLGNAFFVLISRLLLGYDLKDLSTGYRLFRRDLTPQILTIDSKGLCFSMHLTLLAASQNWRVQQIPIRYEIRIGCSKLSVLRDGVKFVWLMLRHKWQAAHPLR